MESPTVIEVKVGTSEVDTRPLTAFLVHPHKVLGIPEQSTPEHIHSAYVLLLRSNRLDATMPEEQWQKCMERRKAIEAAYLRLVPWADMKCFHAHKDWDCPKCDLYHNHEACVGPIVAVWQVEGETVAICAKHYDVWACVGFDDDKCLWEQENDVEVEGILYYRQGDYQESYLS